MTSKNISIFRQAKFIYFANIKSKTFLLEKKKFNCKSYNLNTVYLWIIVRTHIKKERSPDIVQSSPFHRSTGDHSIQSQIEWFNSSLRITHIHHFLKCNFILYIKRQFLTQRKIIIMKSNTWKQCIWLYIRIQEYGVTICTSSPYINGTFQGINLFSITFVEALHFEMENEEHCENFQRNALTFF